MSYLFNLPDELLEEIYKHLPFQTLAELHGMDSIAEDVYQKHLRSIGIIQRAVKQHRIVWVDYEEETDWERRKKMLVRLYIATYPEKHLYGYPIFLAEKMRRPDLQEWIEKNPIKTRRDVQNFLSLEGVSEYDITYAGW
jgi:hypothetical protein